MKALAIIALIFSALSVFIPVIGIFLAMLCSILALITFRHTTTISGITFGINIVSTAFLSPTIIAAEALNSLGVHSNRPHELSAGSIYMMYVGFHIVFLFVALAWQFTWESPMMFGDQPRPAGKGAASTSVVRRCPHCAESIQAEANICRFCQRSVQPRSKEIEAEDAARLEASQLERNRIEAKAAMLAEEIKADETRAEARAILAAEIRRQEEARKPKGTCPNCKSVISLDKTDCPECKANFGVGSAWKITRLRT